MDAVRKHESAGPGAEAAGQAGRAQRRGAPGGVAVPARHHVSDHGQRRAAPCRTGASGHLRRRALRPLCRPRHGSRVALSSRHRRASLLAVILLDITDCYQLSALMRPVANLGRIATVWAGTLALFAVAGFFLKLADDFSRLWFGGWFVTGLVLLLGPAPAASPHDQALGAQRHHRAPRGDRGRRQGCRGR